MNEFSMLPDKAFAESNPSTGYITAINLENGEERTIYLATDSCDTWLSSGVYYEYSGFEDLEELKDYFYENGKNLNAPICSFGDDIAVKNYEILSEYAFQWLSWEDVSEVLPEELCSETNLMK